jgi:steroid delta-isomerase-like uncharacterized protein
MRMPTSLVEFATAYSGAWASHDPDAIAAMHTDDSVFDLHDLGAPATGRAAVRDLIATLLKIAPDLRFKPVRVHFGGEHFVTEYVMSGTAQGKPFAIAGADVFTMREGLVGRKDTYLDWLAYERQVGIDPSVTIRSELGLAGSDRQR